MISSSVKYLLCGIMLFLLAIPNTGMAQKAKTGGAAEIKFIENSWTEALKQAEKQNKYIFVDAYTTWCGPCKMLKRTTFKDKTAADFYNKNFVNLSIDMEKGQGPKLGSEWSIESIPTLIIFTPQGKRVLYSVGFIAANDLLRFGKEALAKKIR